MSLLLATSGSKDHLCATSGLPPTADIAMSAMGSRSREPKPPMFSTWGTAGSRRSPQSSDRGTPCRSVKPTVPPLFLPSIKFSNVLCKILTYNTILQNPPYPFVKRHFKIMPFICFGID